jgi:hypothetical protein
MACAAAMVDDDDRPPANRGEKPLDFPRRVSTGIRLSVELRRRSAGGSGEARRTGLR